ncbi:MAG TPA: SH3 domain-containing protein [Propionibacterium sp.]|nr:SH3 domain-containing protein [Propionibacterium sp.]
MSYQPRRIAEAASFENDGAAAFVVAPRRAARNRSEFLRTRVAPTAVSVALLATSGAFALNLRAADESTSAVPAPVREADIVSRDTARELVSTEDVATEEAAEAPAEEAAEVATEGDAAFVSGQWAAVFGTPAGTKFAQANTVVRAQASTEAESLGSVKEGDKISVTDKVEGTFRQVAFNGKVGYVLEARLGDKAPVKEAPKPAPAKATAAKATAAKSTTKAAATKSSGSAPAKYEGSKTYSGKTVLGLKPKAMVVYNAVTARWSFKAIGGYRATNNRSNHGSGGAIDFMTYSDSAKGWAVAKYVAANASAFDVDHIIFEQKIWTPYKPYWRPMADRGSITANHYDHVHVSVKL